MSVKEPGPVRGFALLALALAPLACTTLPGAADAQADLVHLSPLGAPIVHAEPCETRGTVDAVLADAMPTIVSGELENGLRFVLVPRPDDPVVSLRVVYDVGARDEAPGRGGVAHLFEHMMFKGGGRVPDGGHFRAVRDVGGFTNATTDYDMTQYWENVPRAALARALFLEAERMRGLHLSRAHLDNQRAAIREEGLGLENLPYVDAAAAFGLALWAGTPYGHSPIGTPEELAAMTPAEAERFHRAWYGPANAVVVLVGGFDPARAERAIGEAFGPIPSRPRPPARATFALDETPRHTIAEDPLAPFPIVAVVWHAPGATRADAAAIAVLDDLLMGHPDARFDRAVVAPASLDAYPLTIAFRDVGLLSYVFVPRTFVPAGQLRARVEDEVARLLRDGPTAAETCRSVARELRERLAPLATAEGVAAALARAAVFQGDPHAFEGELRAIEAVDAASVSRVAEQVLGAPMHTLEIRPVGTMHWVKRVLEWLPDGVGASFEDGLL